MNREYIAKRLTENGIPFLPDLPEKLETDLRLLLEWNGKMDLTAVEGEEELLDKHLVDSLTVLKTALIPEGASLIDVGTGAGFPGLILAMARPDCEVTLLDSQRKRLAFLEAVAEEAHVRNIHLVHARAEDGGRNPSLRERFDIAAARAVAPLAVLCEYLLPYVRVGGRALCWKGPALDTERDAGRRAAFLLGGKTEEEIRCPIAGRDWDHRILPVLKTAPTPQKYPRRPGVPKSSPLGT